MLSEASFKYNSVDLSYAMTSGKKTSIFLVIRHRQKAGLANGCFDSSQIQTSPLVQRPILLMPEWFSVASDPTTVLSPKRIQHLLLFSLLGLLFLGILSKSILPLGAQGPHHKIQNVSTMSKNLWASLCHFNFNLIRKDKKFPAAFSSAITSQEAPEKNPNIFNLSSYKFLSRDQ